MHDCSSANLNLNLACERGNSDFGAPVVIIALCASPESLHLTTYSIHHVSCKLTRYYNLAEVECKCEVQRCYDAICNTVIQCTVLIPNININIGLLTVDVGARGPPRLLVFAVDA
jgi:hypothetical protein